MKDITIIIPVHIYNNEVFNLLTTAINSVRTCRKEYTFGKLPLLIVAPQNVNDELEKNNISSIIDNVTTIVNDGDTDFCSQVNKAASCVNTDYFSILEFDDLYNEKWFNMVNDYFFSNESVSLFLPINILTDTEHKHFQFANEIAWTSSFSNEIGYLDFDCLQDYSSFNLTGGVFNTNDFKKIGGFKSSIKAAFNYEFLLRMTKKELKVFVVPKEGYIHMIGRKGSLTDEYNQTLTVNDVKKWFDLAKSEYLYTEDRKINIDKIKTEETK